MHHLRRGDPHRPSFPPTCGASPSPLCTAPAALNSDPACSFDAAILAHHVTGWRAWPEPLGRDLKPTDSSFPGPRRLPPCQKSRFQMGGDWAWRPETAASHWLRERRTHPRARLWPARLVLRLQFVSPAASRPTWREPEVVRAQACCCAASSPGGWGSRALTARSSGLVGVLRLWLLRVLPRASRSPPRRGQSSAD